MRTVELVRHASAGKRGSWNGPDRERPLDDRGRRQAQLLADLLTPGPPLVAFVSSPSVRCVQTIEPLAAAAGRKVAEEPGLAEASAPPPIADAGEWHVSAWLGGCALAVVDRLLAETEDGTRIVACSHGDTAPALLTVLAARDGVALERVHLAKAGWATLVFEDRRCVRAEVHPAPDDRRGG